MTTNFRNIHWVRPSNTSASVHIWASRHQTYFKWTTSVEILWWICSKLNGSTYAMTGERRKAQPNFQRMICICLVAKNLEISLPIYNIDSVQNKRSSYRILCSAKFLMHAPYRDIPLSIFCFSSFVWFTAKIWQAQLGSISFANGKILPFLWHSKRLKVLHSLAAPVLIISSLFFVSLWIDTVYGYNIKPL